jgi:hypothetical protein
MPAGRGDPNWLISRGAHHGLALATLPGRTKDTRHERDPGGPNAMLLTTLITVVFIGATSAVLWLSIGAD